MQDTVTPDLTRKGKGKVKAITQNPATAAPVLPAIAVTPPSNTPITCLVCADEFSYSATPPADAAILPSRPPTERCAHPAGICTSCLSQTISATLEAHGAAQPIRCPDATCTEVMSRDDVKTWASDNTFARWDMLSLRELMRTDATTNPDGGLFVWCQSPYCYSGQLHPQGDAQPMVTCIRCSEKTCFTHSTMWHEGQTCKQYDRSRPVKDIINRGVSRAAIWWRSRSCPGCFQPVSFPLIVPFYAPLTYVAAPSQIM
jgi:IBR domain, a half RING-finger domain